MTDIDADAALSERFAANCRALGLDLPMPALTACRGRDGSITAQRNGHWLAGCSVPRLTAERMIRKETWPHRALCLLGPTHGQQIAAVLAKLPRTNALIAVFTSPESLADALACCDVVADAAAGRMHVAWDETSLAAIFERHPGLAVPRQIVRLPDADPAVVSAALPWTQATLTGVASTHARRTAASTDRAAAQGTAPLYGPLRDAEQAALGAIVGRRFRLWNDWGETLARVLDGRQLASRADSASRDRQASLPANGKPAPAGALERRADVIVLDTDHPLAGADAAVPEHTAACIAVLADRPRPAFAKSPTPWVAWLTGDEVLPFNASHAADALLLTTPAAVVAARTAGWPADRVSLAGWPNLNLSHTPGRPLAFLCDVPDLAPPADIAAFGSRQIVWEAIRDELCRDPFALGGDAERYGRRAPARLGLLPVDDFPVRRFVDGIVGPAFAVGVATWLAARGIAFTLHGYGWDAIDALAGHDRGPVEDRDAFESIVAASGGVVDAFLSPAHPCRSLGVPVLTVFGHTPQRVTQNIAALSAGRTPAPVVASSLTLHTIESLLAG